MPSWTTYKGLRVPDVSTGDAGINLTDDLKFLADELGEKLPVASDSYVVVKRGASDTASAANLRAAYATAKGLTPGGNALSATNRATVLIPPGRYDFGTGDGSNHGLVLDAQYVDLIGISSNPDNTFITYHMGAANRGTLEQTANDVHIANLTAEVTSGTGTGAAYYPDSGLAAAKLTNVVLIGTINPYATRGGITYSGTYVKVVCGYKGFGDSTVASGLFVDCVVGEYGFGGFGTASGTFLRCVGGNTSFGSLGTASGTFIDCLGGGSAFGGQGGTASGVFNHCKLGSRSGGSTTLGTSSWGGTFTGLMDECFWKVTGSNQTALIVGSGGRVYNSTLIGTGTGKSIDAASGSTHAVIAQCRLNKGIGTNVVNDIGTPYNVDDADIS